MNLIDKATHLGLKIGEIHAEKVLDQAETQLLDWSKEGFRKEHKVKKAKEAIEKAISVKEVEAAAKVLPDTEENKNKASKAKAIAIKKEEKKAAEIPSSEKGVPLKTPEEPAEIGTQEFGAEPQYDKSKNFLQK